MKRLDLGQAISVLANLGVIAGIVFLAVELRQNNEWLASESRYNHSQNRADWHRNLATDDQLARIITKAQQGEQLMLDEQTKITNLYLYLFTQWEWEYGEQQLGRSELSIEGYRGAFSKNPTTGIPFLPGIRETWESYKTTYADDFRIFMDEMIVQ